MAHDVEEAGHGRFRRLDPRALADQLFVLVVVENAAVSELPREDDGLARQAAVSTDRSMAPAAATSAKIVACTNSVRGPAQEACHGGRGSDRRDRNGDGVPDLARRRR